MKINESGLDRILRVVIGIGLLGVGIFAGIQGAWQIVLLALGGLLLITGLTGYCLIYRLFRVSTKKA